MACQLCNVSVDCRETDKAVIYLKEHEVGFVEFDNNCIIIKGEGSDMLKAVDKLLLYWYGVILPDAPRKFEPYGPLANI